MKNRRRIALAIAVGLLALLGAAQVLGQVASRPGYSVGTAGSACDGTNILYGWPDANGNILKCVANVWQAQGTTASAGGSNTQVQYNSGGALAGDSGLTYVNPNLTIGYGSLYIGTSSATTGTLYIGGLAAHSYPATDTNCFGCSIAIGPSALANMPAMPAGASYYSNIAIGSQVLSSASMTTGAIFNTGMGHQSLKSVTSGSNNTALGYGALFGDTSGSLNTSVGVDANWRGTGSNNTAVGSYAMQDSTVASFSGGSNTAIGGSALLRIQGTSSSNTALGVGALAYLGAANSNVALGTYAGGNLTTGSNNTLVGASVGTTTLATGSYNILIGNDATTDTFSASSNNAIGVGSSVKPGTGDIAIGYQALATNAGDNLNNVAIGSQAMSSASMTSLGTSNVAIGLSSMSSLTSGSQNTAIGRGALSGVTNGVQNTAIGSLALQNLSAGGNDVGVGRLAGQFISTGIGNVAIGYAAMQGVTGNRLTGHRNVAIGMNAGLTLQGGATYNGLFGDNAGAAITTGTDNLVIGSSVASTTLNTGSNNILIGTNGAVDTPAQGTNNFLNIGNLIYGTSIGTAASPGNVGIGTTVPLNRLDVSGGEVVGAGYVGTTTGPSNGLIVQGNVGIGSTSPGSALDVAGAAYATGNISTGNNFNFPGNSGYITWGGSSNNSISANAAGGSQFIAFRTAGSERVRIDANGNVGLGTNAPLNKLDVSGGAVIGAGYIGTVTAAANGLTVQGNVAIGQPGTSTFPLTIYTTSTSSDRGVGITYSAPDANGPVIRMYKTRGAAVQSLDELARISSYGYDGTASNESTKIASFVDGSVSSSIVPSKLVFYTTDTSGNLATRMVIRATGNVGIGTGTPLNTLDVSGGSVIGAGYIGTVTASTNGLTVQGNTVIGGSSPVTSNNSMLTVQGATTGSLTVTNGTVQTQLTSGAGAGWVQTYTNHPLYFATNNSSAQMALSTAGNVGIGSTSPVTTLDVNGQIYGHGVSISTSTVNWAQGNVQGTTQSCGAFSFSGMQDGGSYSLAILGTTSATCSFSNTDSPTLTFLMPSNHGSTTSGTKTLYHFIRQGTNVFVSWLPGY